MSEASHAAVGGPVSRSNLRSRFVLSYTYGGSRNVETEPPLVLFARSEAWSWG